MRVLVIEDDPVTAESIQAALERSGHEAETIGDGEDGLERARSGTYDVLIVDRMLPRRDGLSIIEALREDGDTTPALILSALGEVDDRVEGLRRGGDDYLVKPFAFAELEARLEILARRGRAPNATTRLVVDDLELDKLARRVTRAGREIDLKPREYLLLEYLMENAGTVVTRAMILEAVWNIHFDPQTNLIDVHVSRLRRKIDQFGRPLIHTVRGAGYVIRGGEP